MPGLLDYGAFGTGSPAETADQPSGLDAILRGAYGSLGLLAKRAFGASEDMRQGGAYDAGPAFWASTLPMGTGAIAGVPMRAGEAVLGAGPIRAYHGSPHDFERFSLDKIGTGEGAQAYGHGLYFAEHEPVAMQYRDQLQWKGANFDDPQVLAQNAIDRNGSREAAAANLQSSLDSVNAFHRGRPPPAQAEANRQTEQAIALLRGNDPITGKPNAAGKMYEVNINADPAHFLDWDKPLNQQSPHVQDKLSAAGYSPTDPRLAGSGGAVYNDARSTFKPSGDVDWSNRQAAAHQIEAAVSGGLREAGIPGIKYLDQGSRGAGEGSRNYVVFDDKIIEIMRKYGLLGATAPLGSMLLNNSTDQRS